MTEMAPLTTVPLPVKLRVEDYLMLDDAGAFEAYGKTELIDGVIYPMSPQYRPHGFLKDELAYRLRRALEALGSSLHVATEQSAALTNHSEPQPDIALTSEPRGSGPLPGASIALICEISASTLAFDLNDKARMYASAAVPEYWVVDTSARTITAMWSPVGEMYENRASVTLGEPLAAATIPGLTVDTAAL